MKSKRKSLKRKRRIFVFGLICITVNFAIFYTLGNIWKQIYEKTTEEKKLSNEILSLQKNEEKLKSEVEKLQDPNYLARYAREKYLYSSKDEYVINIK